MTKIIRPVPKSLCLLLLLCLQQIAIASAQEDSQHLRASSSGAGNSRKLEQDEAVPDLEDGSTTVVGGTTASSGEYPFFAWFGNGNCGGTLISNNRVLTAAHCIAGGTPSTVRVGATTTSDGIEMGVSCGKTHPDWSSDNPFFNDLAILKLHGTTEVAFPTRNTNSATPAAGDNVIVIGFGQTTAGSGTGSGSSTLQQLTYSAVDDATCSSQWGGSVGQATNICVQNTASTGACFGDSGGPLLATDKTTQLGLVSGGSSSCASGGLPDVYTEIAFYSSWIDEQIGSCSCDGCIFSPRVALQTFNNWYAQQQTFFAW